MLDGVPCASTTRYWDGQEGACGYVSKYHPQLATNMDTVVALTEQIPFLSNGKTIQQLVVLLSLVLGLGVDLAVVCCSCLYYLIGLCLSSRLLRFVFA